jgi:integrase
MIERHAITVSELCYLYLAEGTTHKKPSTVRVDRGRITHHIKPLLGKKTVQKISRTDIERMMIDVKSGVTTSASPKGGKRPPGSLPTGGTGVAAQCVALTSTILAFAVARGLRSDNRRKALRSRASESWNASFQRKRYHVWHQRLKSRRIRRTTPTASAAIKLLLLTGARRGEIMGLQWQNVDYARKCLRLPDSKTGAKVIFLNDAALEILRGLPRLSDNLHVIAGTRRSAAYVSIDKVWARVRAAAELCDVRLHDLRHSFASMAVGDGFSLPIIGALLGHKNSATTARYAHLASDPLRAANEAVGAKIATALRIAPSPEGAVTIPKRSWAGP